MTVTAVTAAAEKRMVTGEMTMLMGRFPACDVRGATFSLMMAEPTNALTFVA
jgi:hypothetical protein